MTSAQDGILFGHKKNEALIHATMLIILENNPYMIPFM